MAEVVEQVSEALVVPSFVESVETTETPKPAEVGPTDQKIAGEAPAPADKAVTPEPAEKLGKSRFERRLDKAYRRAAEAEARANALDQRLKELQPAPKTTGAPRMEDFTEIKDFADATAKYAAEQAVKEHETKRQQEAHATARRQLTEGWEAKVTKAEAKYDDFDEIVGDLKPDSPWSMALMGAENGADIAHYLGTHLKEAERIVSLDPLSQIREIGRLQAKLEAEPPKPKAPSQAPAPITPVSGNAGAASDLPLPSDDMGTWMKKRQAQVHGKRG